MFFLSQIVEKVFFIFLGNRITHFKVKIDKIAQQTKGCQTKDEYKDRTNNLTIILKGKSVFSFVCLFFIPDCRKKGFGAFLRGKQNHHMDQSPFKDISNFLTS